MTDTERLDWLTSSGAMVAFSKDGDDCWLHWPYDPDDEEGESFNQAGCFASVREAIDAAILFSGKCK